METNRPIETDEIDLLEIAAKLWKRKWIIVLITIIPTLLMVAYALLKIEHIPLYRATTAIETFSEEHYSMLKLSFENSEFIEKINKKFPSLTKENFSIVIDEKNKAENKKEPFTLSVISPEQDIVAPATNYAIDVLITIFKNNFASTISEQIERVNYQSELKTALENSIKEIRNKSKNFKSKEDLAAITLAINTANECYNDLKLINPDYEKINVLEKASTPKLSIQEEDKLRKKREGELSGKWTSRRNLTIITFFICFFLSVFLVLAVDFIKNNKDKFKEYLNKS